MGRCDRLTLQLQQKEWGDGAFVDYFGTEIEDGSVLRLIVEQSEESPLEPTICWVVPLYSNVSQSTVVLCI